MHMLYTQAHTHTYAFLRHTQSSLKRICKINTYDTLKAEINKVTKFIFTTHKTFMNVLWMGKGTYCSKRVLKCVINKEIENL